MSPIYEFICRQCGYTFEALVKRSEADEARCPGCGSETLRCPGTVTVRFKGDGWQTPKAAGKEE